MSKFQQFFPDEEIYFEHTGWYIKGFLNVKTGTILLTDKRIAFIEQKQIVGGGLIVAAADAVAGASRPKLRVDVPFVSLKSWEQPRKNDIRIEDAQGQKFTLRGVDYPKWDEKLKQHTH